MMKKQMVLHCTAGAQDPARSHRQCCDTEEVTDSAVTLVECCMLGTQATGDFSLPGQFIVANLINLLGEKTKTEFTQVWLNQPLQFMSCFSQWELC